MYKSRLVPMEVEYSFGKIPMDKYMKIHAGRLPDKPCMIFYGTEITFKEMDEYIDKMAAYLASVGVKKGDPVILFMQNCPQFTISFFAVQRLGAIVCPFNPMFKKLDIEFEANELKAKVIISNTYQYELINSVRSNTSIETVILTSVTYFLPENPTYSFVFENHEPASMEDVTLMMETIKDIEPKTIDADVSMDDVSLILFTSGTTGLPKGAMLTYMNTLFIAAVTAPTWHQHAGNIWLQTQPMCHIAGIDFANVPFLTGATLVVVTQQSPRIFCEAVAAHRCDCWYGGALMARNIIDQPDVEKYDLSSMRLSVMSSFGIQTTKELSDEWAKITQGGLLCESAYGLTESHTQATIMPPEHVVWGSNGCCPFEEMKVKIVEDGEDVPVGEVGEIWVKNQGVFKGYWGNPEATAEILMADGWLRTGDAGKMDADGFLYFLGRRKEMIKSLGYSVFPDEVEMYLTHHEAIDKSCIISKVIDGKESVKAFVVLRPEYVGKVTETDIIEWSKDLMSTYKRPREVEFVDSIPTTTSGKLMRRKMREYEEEKGRVLTDGGEHDSQ